ncbi:hypothetical protein ACFVVA_20670 [Kitasatospora sp. NPDC058048]|uniref:hypothetical protein n=1 Tax=Kitasatospora sp. NPDC058048 TaxID=3346313 RepID=UPI0036D8121D
MTDTPATPLAAARALHLAVLHEGGRVRAAEVGAEDGPALRRLVELGLPVPQLVDGSDSAMDPRAVGERIGGDLRRTGTRLLAEADRIPEQLREPTRAHDAVPRRSEPGGGVRRPRGMAGIRYPVSQLVKDHPHEALGAQPVARGLTQRAIAGRMGLGERTVAGHIARLRELFDAETLFQWGRRRRGSRTGESGG